MKKPANDASQPKNFRIFRASEAQPFEVIDFQNITPIISQGLEQLSRAGVGDGAEVRVLFDAPGFSLTYAWFKSGFPLPLHSHEADCLYYVTAGSLELGTETIRKGDGFFVPGGVPYSYTPGSEGVEVIEMRHCACADIKLRSNSQAYWDKMVARAELSNPRWQQEAKPSLGYLPSALSVLRSP